MWWIPRVQLLHVLWLVFLVFRAVHTGVAWAPVSFSTRIRQTSSTCCRLFLRPSNTKQSSTAWKIPSRVIDCMRPKKLPWNIQLEPTSLRNLENSNQAVLTIRPMRFADLDAIVDMCVHEYGSGSVDFPLWNPLRLGAWLDRQYLRWLVETTCRVKLLLYDVGDEDCVVNDHAILVAAINADGSDENNAVVGMIEISLQPLVPQRTPPPFPVPLLLKQVLASFSTNCTELVGWITNLLIASPYRGQGYSKALVIACETIAMSWRCPSIHLHCDADPTTGRVPQKLYHRLGYRSSPTSRFAFPQTNIVEIEGVPLLYLRKNILEN